MATSQECMDLDHHYAAPNYHPLPMVFARASGVHVYDPEGNEYIDCLSAYSAVNQGHSHPRIIKALVDQAQVLALSSRAFYNNKFGAFSKAITERFGYDKVLPMNTGAEAVETALKAARRWGYRVKGIPSDEAVILVASENFHGRTITIISFSCDEGSKHDFGPATPGFRQVEFGDTAALERVMLEIGDRLAAVMVEPVQGEAGCVVPPEGYLSRMRQLCTEHNVLMIADEVQCGLGRTGAWLACDHEQVRPDLVILGKALSGGVYPVSCVLADSVVLDLFTAGSHGSTYGGNPIAAAVATEALAVLDDEGLVTRAGPMGQLFRDTVAALDSPLIESVRGRGLLNAVVIKPTAAGIQAWHVCLLMKQHGVLAKQTHDHIIRFAPPLTITEEQLHKVVDTFAACLKIAEACKSVEEVPGWNL